MRTYVTGLVCLSLATAALGQANSQPELKTRANTQVQDMPSATAQQQVAPDAPVITLQGVCDNPSASSADCQTVVTRAEFEKLTNGSTVPKPQEKQMATRYATILILANKGRQLGMDKSPEFDEQMKLMRLQLLATMARDKVVKQASNVSDAEVENYYQQHPDEFKKASYDKLFVPKVKAVTAAQGGTTAASTSAADAQKKREADEAAMKAEADKLRARAAAGEDFTRLQQDAYNFAGQNLKAANTRVDNAAKNRMSPADANVFQLKPGQVSEVISEPQGFMIYKVASFQTQTLADVRPEVQRTLQNQKVQEAMQALQQSITEKVTYNEAYFAVPPAPSLRNPGEAPHVIPAPSNSSAPNGSMTSAPGKK